MKGSLGHSVAEQRPAWFAIQWRMWLSEARRTGRGLFASRPSIDLLNRRDGCRERCDYHRNSEKHDGSAVAISLVTHEGTSAQGKHRAAGMVPPRSLLRSLQLSAI
jgi:hypothetical protein